MKICHTVNVERLPLHVSLYVVPTICEPLVGQPIAACTEQHPHLLGLELANFSSLSVDVFIGSDYYWELVTGSVCRGSNGPTAAKTGQVLSGPSSHSEPNQCNVNLSVTHVLHVETFSDDLSCTLDDQLRAFCELESLGIQDKEKTV